MTRPRNGNAVGAPAVSAVRAGGPGPDGRCGGWGSGGQGAVDRRRHGAVAVGAEADPVLGRRGARGAPEGLRELGRLAIAHAPRDLAHGEAAPGQELGCPAHAHGGQVLAEGRAADLGVGPLELAARGGDAAGDVVQVQVGAVLGLDDRDGVAIEVRAEGHGGCTLHDPFYAPEGPGDEPWFDTVSILARSRSSPGSGSPGYACDE